MFVYLDTSFLSQFAKVEMGQLGVSSHAEKWGELLARLRHEVQRGTLICPVSEFQIQGALLDPKLVPQFILIQSELSRGYFFKYWQDILVHQTANQVLRYLRRPQDINLGWNALIRVYPDIVPPQTTINAKKDVMQYHEELQKQGTLKRSYAEQYEAERNALIYETFLQPFRQMQGLATYSKSRDPVKDLLQTGFFGMLLREANVSKNEFSKVHDFFFEPELVDQIPYIHIFCSIYASLRFYERTRKPKGGDFLDVPALACAMPYCPIVTTDKSMAHIVKSRELDTKYGTEIFTPTTKGIDDLLGKLEAFAQ